MATNAAVVGLALGLCLAMVIAFAGGWAGTVIVGLESDGLLAVGFVLAAGLIGGVVVHRFGSGGLFGWLTAVGIGMGIFSLATLLLGLGGMLNTPIAWCLVLGCAAVGLGDVFWRGRTAAIKPWMGPVIWLRRPAGWNWLMLLIVPAVAIALTGASIMPGWLWKPLDPHPYDVLSYHLAVPRQWYEAGRITPLTCNVFSYFPFNVEMWSLLVMHLNGGPLGAWESMYIVQYLSTICMVLTVLATGAITGQVLGRRHAAPVAAVLAALVPWLAMLGAVAYVENALLLYLTLSVGWALAAWHVPNQAVRRMALAGVLAGLAAGVKYTAVPILLVALPPAWLAAVWLAKPRPAKGDANGDSDCLSTQTIHPRTRILSAGAFYLAAMLVFSPWLIRNAIWTGNPIFPLGLHLFGPGYFNPQQVERFIIAHRAPPEWQSVPRRLLAAWQEIATDWQFAFVLLPAGAIALLLGAFRRQRVALFLLLLLLIQLAVWITATHLKSRFFVPAIPLAVVGLGAVVYDRRAAIGAGLAVICTGIGLACLLPCFLGFLPLVRQGLFQLHDLSALDPPELKNVENGPYRLALIGDAQPFLHRVPMNRTDYRCVFDVAIGPQSNLIDGWLGKSVVELRKDHYVLISVSELRRLAGTADHPGSYRHLPPLPQRVLIAPGQMLDIHPDDSQIILPPLP